MARDPVTAADFDALEGLDAWRYGNGRIETVLHADSFAAAGTLAARIAEEADAADHHPDLALHYPGTVHVTLASHDVGTVTTADVDLARTISALAADAGVDAAPPES